MDFDKPKVYGDTSITDGLVFQNDWKFSNSIQFQQQTTTMITNVDIYAVLLLAKKSQICV